MNNSVFLEHKASNSPEDTELVKSCFCSWTSKSATTRKRYTEDVRNSTAPVTVVSICQSCNSQSSRIKLCGHFQWQKRSSPGLPEKHVTAAVTSLWEYIKSSWSGKMRVWLDKNVHTELHLHYTDKTHAHTCNHDELFPQFSNVLMTVFYFMSLAFPSPGL